MKVVPPPIVQLPVRNKNAHLLFPAVLLLTSNCRSKAPVVVPPIYEIAMVLRKILSRSEYVLHGKGAAIRTAHLNLLCSRYLSEF